MIRRRSGGKVRGGIYQRTQTQSRGFIWAFGRKRKTAREYRAAAPGTGPTMLLRGRFGRRRRFASSRDAAAARKPDDASSLHHRSVWRCPASTCFCLVGAGRERPRHELLRATADRPRNAHAGTHTHTHTSWRSHTAYTTQHENNARTQARTHVSDARAHRETPRPHGATPPTPAEGRNRVRFGIHVNYMQAATRGGCLRTTHTTTSTDPFRCHLPAS